MSPVKKIAIIGAGASGLTAIKQCADYGHEVKCFESTDDIGGLWRYREEDLDGIPSVAKSTISNTSKELSSFSDFPAPAEFPNFLPNQVLCKYFELYADRFDLRKYIRFNHKVLSLERSHDYSTTGQWKITYSHRDSVFEEIFDGVMVCSGHHVYPRIPEFPGQEKFQGLITHTHSYKKPEGFENKKVVVVGFANSALDAATELSTVADQVYLAVRTPGWVSTRTGFQGWPRDNITTSRAMTALAGTLGSWWSTLIQANLNSNFDQDLYGIKPKHQLHNQHPIISDHIASCIISQRVKVRKNIKSFTRNGIIFEDDDQEVPVDVVVFGTGYEMKFPFISDPEIFSCVDDKIELYKNVFNANLEHPETLAYIGLVSPLGPIFPVVEMQSRWFAAIMKGEAKLPSTSEMKQAVKEFSETLWKTFYQSARNSLEVKFVPYMDEMAEAIGCKPDLYWTAIYDPKLWLALIFGPGCSYQYRLRGPHAWKGARDALINTSSRVTEGFKSSLEIRNLDKYDFSRNGTNGINGKNGKIVMNSFIEHCEKPYKNGKKNIDMNDNDHVKSSDFMHAIS